MTVYRPMLNSLGITCICCHIVPPYILHMALSLETTAAELEKWFSLKEMKSTHECINVTQPEEPQQEFSRQGSVEVQG